MKRFAGAADIAAPPSAVWAVLGDFAQWIAFDPATEKIEGRAEPGAKVIVTSTFAPTRPVTVTITGCVPPSTLDWAAGSRFTVRSERRHLVTPTAAGSRIEVTEQVSGPMAGVVLAALPDLGAVLAAFCAGLKARVEGAAAIAGPAAGATLPDRHLRMTRRFDASPERLFDAWIDPAMTRKWLMTSPASEATISSFDARAGGKWRIADTRNGTTYEAMGEYRVVDRPKKLVFTFAMPMFSANADTITVEIAPDGAGSLLTFTQQGTDIADELRSLAAGAASGSEKGWGEMFDLLAAALATG